MAHILGHLDYDTFCKELDILEDRMGKAVEVTADEWVRKGYIDEDGKRKMLESWNEEKYSLFTDVID